MANLELSYTLKNPKASKDTEVWARSDHNGIGFVYPLVSIYHNNVLRIPPELWDKQTRRPIKKSTIPSKYKKYSATVDEISSLIDLINGYFPDIISEARIQEIDITKEYLKSSLDVKLGKKEKVIKSKITVVDFLDSTIKKMRTGELLTNKKIKYAEGTIKPYHTLMNNIKIFDHIRDESSYFDSINESWYDDFIIFLYNEYDCPEQDIFKEEYAPNSVGKYIKSLKMIMGLAFSNGLMKTKEYEQKYFQSPTSDVYAVVLGVDELESLYQLKLTRKEDQEYRDLFLVGAYSGLRLSDYNKIKASDFSYEGDTLILSVYTKKTKTWVKIPVVDNFKRIVELYNYNLPKVNSVVFNRQIKKIAKLAGITKEVTYSTWKGGESKMITKPKYELIASHTCRRSYITNLYFHYGVDYERIMKISGHKTVEQLKKYIRFGDTKNAVEVAKVISEKHKNDNK